MEYNIFSTLYHRFVIKVLTNCNILLNKWVAFRGTISYFWVKCPRTPIKIDRANWERCAFLYL